MTTQTIVSEKIEINDETEDKKPILVLKFRELLHEQGEQLEKFKFEEIKDVIINQKYLLEKYKKILDEKNYQEFDFIVSEFIDLMWIIEKILFKTTNCSKSIIKNKIGKSN